MYFVELCTRLRDYTNPAGRISMKLGWRISVSESGSRRFKYVVFCFFSYIGLGLIESKVDCLALEGGGMRSTEYHSSSTTIVQTHRNLKSVCASEKKGC